MKLNLKDSTISESSNIASQGYLESILDLGGSSPGSSLSSSKRYGTSGCSINDITQTESDYEVHYTCNVYHYKSSSNINGSAKTTEGSKTGIFLLSQADYNLCNYDSNLCPVNIPTPAGLTQSFIAPETTDSQSIDIGASIGKFQSGSGVIFGAEIESDTPEDYNLRIEVYLTGSLLPLTFAEEEFTNTGLGQVTIPNLPAGEYYWTAKAVDNTTQEISEVEHFGENIFLNTDFEIFEGFEPYPYGYSFENRGTDSDSLTGGISGFFNKEIIPGTKWEIFDSIFAPEIFLNERERMSSFESQGLNNKNPTIFSNGSCYGLALTSALYKKYPHVFHDFFPLYYDSINGNIFKNITLDINSDGKWMTFNNDLKSILVSQLLQYLPLHQNLENISIETQTPQDILNMIKNYPENQYILTFSGKESLFSPKKSHAVVPYKVEGNKIYVWDNNVPYPNIQKDELYSAYEQYIEVTGINKNDFTSHYYNTEWNWDYFSDFALINVSDLLTQNESKSLGFNDGDSLYTLSGEANFIIQDSEGRVTGFQGGEVFEEIPGIRIILPVGVTGAYQEIENTWKQIYLPQKRDDLTIEISGTTDENYNLMIAGGDYYTKLEGVATSSGQIDTFTSTAINLEIDFDDTKTGSYNLLVDNFQNSGTGTIYVDAVDVVPEAQGFTIDWTKVVENADDALTYETDSDNDGTFDTIISVPAITTGEELIEEKIVESIYTYPTKTISWNSGQQRAISSYYSIVPNFNEYNWGEDIAFTTSGEGNPTVNTTNSGRQSSGVLRGGANIQIDVPSTGESYTAYLHIGEHTLEYTVTREEAPAPDVGILDFGTKTVNYGGIATSNWVSFPFLSEDTTFTLTGDGNPTAQTVNGQRSNTGFVRWGTNIKAEIPESGETRTIEFEILGQTGTFTIIRQ